MTAFVFAYLNKVTDSYHHGGGLLVIAQDKAQVVDLIAKENDVVITSDEWETVHTYPLADSVTEPRVFVFPDQGCC